jgi:hypothetical protein
MIPATPRSDFARALVFSLVLLASAAPARAQFPQRIVNDDLTGEENRQDPALIGLDDGGFLLLWVDNGRAQQDILVRRFDAQLQPLAPPALVNDDEGISRQFGVITSPARGGRSLAAWLDERDGVVAVFTQLFRTDDGQPVGPNQRITADRSLGLRDAPAVATGASGASLVAWEEGTYGRRRIRCRLIAPAGNTAGPPIEVAVENPDRIQRCPAVAALPDGRWLAAWFEMNRPNFELRFRLLAADGSPLGSSTLAHTERLIDPGQGPDPALLVRAEDAFLVWIDNTEGTGDLFGRRLDLAGNLLSERVLMRTAKDPFRDIDPRLHAAPDGSFALTWFGGNPSRTYPQFRLFGTDGSPQTVDLAITDRDIGVVSRVGTAIAMPDNRWLLAWSDDRTQSLQIYLRKVAGDGSPDGPTLVGWSVPGSASQFLADVAMRPDGRALVAWGDFRNGTFNIFARLLDSAGDPEGQSFQVNTLPPVPRFSGPPDAGGFLRLRPSVAASPAGSFVVVWPATATGGGTVLMGQLLDGEGQPIGDNFPVGDSHSSRSGQSDPRPAMALDGSFVITWHDNAGAGVGDQVMIQRFDAQGTRLGQPFTPVDSVGAAASQVFPTIAVSPFGDMVAAWEDRRGRSWDIYRMRLDQLGRPIERGNAQVSLGDDPGNDQLNPSIATNGAAIVTVWDDNPSSAGLIKGRLEILETLAGHRPAGRPGEARFLRVKANPIDFTVNEFDHPTGPKNPRVTMENPTNGNPGGRFVVSWWDERDGQRRVWARRYAADGQPIGAPYSIIGGETRGIRILAAAAANAGAIQYAWSDSRRSRGWDVYSRRVDWDYGGEATPVLLESWEVVSLADGLRIRWEIPLGANGGLFRAWRDPAAGPADHVPTPEAVVVPTGWVAASADGIIEIVDREPPRGEAVRYFLEVSGAGLGREFIGPVEATWDPPALAWSAEPNPSRTMVRFRSASAGSARVEIFDTAGRRLRVLERGEGTAPLEWDGRDPSGLPLASGIYFARVRAAGAPWGTLRLVRIR